MTGFVLHVATKLQKHVLKSLSPSSSVGMLKRELSELAGIPVYKLDVLTGDPPIHLELNEDQSTLESLDICSGDQLIVQEKNVISEVCETDHPTQRSGVLVKKIVPADNSCLFTSVRFALSGEVDTNYAVSMRQIIAEVVENDPETYNEAILGRPNSDYCDWILRPTSWGGAIELAILSKFYGVEIVVVDTVNGILNQFGEDQSYSYRIFLFFDGVHYDPLYFDSEDETVKPKTLFPISNESILSEADSLAKEAKASYEFTEGDRFIIKCLECNIFLKGQSETAAHVRTTGHKSFSEVNP